MDLVPVEIELSQEYRSDTNGDKTMLLRQNWYRLG